MIPRLFRNLPAGPRSEKAVHRSELGIPADAEVIGVIGRLAPDKRVEDLLEVMPQLVAEFPSAVLLLVGDGPSSDSVRDAVRRRGSRRPRRDRPGLRRRRGAGRRDRRCRRPPDGAGRDSRSRCSKPMRAGRAIVTTSTGSNLTVAEADRSALGPSRLRPRPPCWRRFGACFETPRSRRRHWGDRARGGPPNPTSPRT